MLPNFICPGAQKSGTSALYRILKQHPDIYLPDCKETRFFWRETNFARGAVWYEQEFFSDVRGERIVGDITPEYMYFSSVPKNIKNTLGDKPKLIFLLRNPIERAYSHYLMSYRRGFEKESFERAIELEESRIRRGEFEKNHFSYLSRGLYARQIRRFLKYFLKDDMKFVLFEDFKRDMPSAINEILSFFHLEPAGDTNFHVNTNPARMPRCFALQNLVRQPPRVLVRSVRWLVPFVRIRGDMKNGLVETMNRLNERLLPNTGVSAETRQNLLSFYRKDIAQLEEIIDKDLRTWLYT